MVSQVSILNSFSNVRIFAPIRIVPASAPVDVRATNQSSTSILVTWGQVPAIDRNGIIISYDVEYTQDTYPAAPTIQNRTVNDTMVILTGLQEYVVYSIRVRASTIVGSGPFSENVTEQTQEAGKFLLRLRSSGE